MIRKILNPSVVFLTSCVIIFSAFSCGRINDVPGQEGVPQVQTPQELTIKAYFPNLIKNPQAEDCALVYPVDRIIAYTKAVGKASIEELLEGITQSEKDEGYFTSLNDRVILKSLTIENGVARADFDERLQEATGGSCRVVSIRSQITQTLKQFPTVQDVIISIDGRVDDILQP